MPELCSLDGLQIDFGLKHKAPGSCAAGGDGTGAARTAAHPAHLAPGRSVLLGEKRAASRAPAGLKKMYVVELPDFALGDRLGDSSSPEAQPEQVLADMETGQTMTDVEWSQAASTEPEKAQGDIAAGQL